MTCWVKNISKDQLLAYYWTDVLVDFNNSPWVRYSQNAMGAGDALARTVLGRYEMRMQAARSAIDRGVDLDDVVRVAAETEENTSQKIMR